MTPENYSRAWARRFWPGPFAVCALCCLSLSSGAFVAPSATFVRNAGPVVPECYVGRAGRDKRNMCRPGGACLLRSSRIERHSWVPRHSWVAGVPAPLGVAFVAHAATFVTGEARRKACEH